MWTQYDENLSQNHFFKQIKLQHLDILQKAAEEQWILCVPRQGTLPPNCTFSVVSDHILMPSQEATNGFTTLSQKNLTKIARKLMENDNVEDHYREIMFEETFYLDEIGRKLFVWCLEGPLFLRGPHNGKMVRLNCLQDCVDFLWSCKDNFHEQIQGKCMEFLRENPNLGFEKLNFQKTMLESLYKHCVGNQDNELLRLAIESVLQHTLHKNLIFWINSATSRKDAKLNKIIRNSQGLKCENDDNFCKAKLELSKINFFTNILDKFNCLKRCTEYLQKPVDELIKTFVYLILKIPMNNWFANLVFLKEFRFSSQDVSDNFSFILSTLEASLEFILSSEFVLLKNSHKSSHENVLFNCVAKKENFVVENVSLKTFCHPLCTCDSCSESLRGDLQENVNENGLNLLHFAGECGNCEAIDYLLENHFLVDFKDGFGRTCLHYAAVNGKQDAILVLLSKNACFCKDSEGNTPLHLACENGHESCVKALIFQKEKVNLNDQNTSGNTPLHLAVKWNFLDIVCLLLSSGADTTIRNNDNLSASNLVSNCHLGKLFENQEEPFVKPTTKKKNIQLLFKAISNDDFPLTCYYLGFNAVNNNLNLKTCAQSCYPLCACNNNELQQENCKLNHKSLGVNAQNNEGFTALHQACRFGRLDTVRLLLDSGANPNLTTKEMRWTPLHLACSQQKTLIVQELMKSGQLNVDQGDHQGNTPLFYACLRENTKIAKILLKNGADPLRKNNFGQTIMQQLLPNLSNKLQRLLCEEQEQSSDEEWLK